MKNLILFIVAICLSFGISAQDNIRLQANLTDCGDKVRLFSFEAIELAPMAVSEADENGFFEFELPASHPRFVYLGKFPTEVLPLIVGPETDIVVEGSCKNMRVAEIKESAINDKYKALQGEMNKNRLQNNRYMTTFMRAESDSQRQAVSEKMRLLDNQKLLLLDSMNRTEPFLGRIAALNTYLSFPNHGISYNNEIEYFGNEFFRYADFSDSLFNDLPWVFDAFVSYTRTMGSVNIPQETMEAFLDRSLQPLQPGTGAHQMALGGVVRALESIKNPSFPTYARKFIELYNEKFPVITANLQNRVEAQTRFEVGRIAPDFTQATPEGEELKLSDLKGNYVLIDFWASWCGPCRMENPNVVRLYNKYKDKGFTILGVSLDDKRDRWLKAIEQDQLTWHHVSDLKGWSNEVAQTYQISSIPRTIMIDPEGKIIGKNLRGASLEKKLEELFGE